MSKTIKYSYCVNENNELVHISNMTSETKHGSQLYCLQCGHVMIPKLGEKRVRHFAHKQSYACDGESYLHKLAKRKIREKFMSSETFPIVFNRQTYCSEKDNCRFFSSEECGQESVRVKSDLKQWEGKVVYDTCEEEIKIGEFRPDLLLTCSTMPKRVPVFIEIFKTHQSEEPKITSGNKIIETFKIESEADIENIIKNGFVEQINCVTYNFEPKIQAKRLTSSAPVKRFALSSNGIARIYNYTDVRCDQLNNKINSNSIIELNIIDSSRYKYSENVDVESREAAWDIMTYFRMGLMYLKHKGMDVRNCILCRFYCYNEFVGKHICVRYKKLNLRDSHPEQNYAQNCPSYRIDQEYLKITYAQLKKEVTEVSGENSQEQ